MTTWTSLLLCLGSVACHGSNLPIHHAVTPIAESPDCPALTVTVDGTPWTGAAYQTAMIERMLDRQTGVYDETLDVVASVGSQAGSEVFRIDVAFDPQRARVRFGRTGGFLVDVSSSATLLPGSTLGRGDTVHVCIAPGTAVIASDSTQPSVAGKRVEISGRIDAVIEEVAVHDGKTK
ncbi:MAG TPA: hypothetical protein VLB44_21495 [Kofleriaceae bacterium]|nr:hypothetical protein [Kofleriaceae bacterium]